MTVILGLITNEFAIHVSDRQLTDLATGKQLVAKASKTVVVPQGRFMVSYTGLARVTPTVTTDEWMMRTLWKIRDSDDYLGELANAATDAFSNVPLHSRMKRHGFLVSGWLGSGSFETDTPLPGGLMLDAYHAFISNFLDFEAGVELHDTTTGFGSRARPLYPHERFNVYVAGVRLTTTEAQELESSIAAALRSPGGGERAAAIAMLRTVERVSRRNRAVGGGAFVCSLPRGYQAPSLPISRPE